MDSLAAESSAKYVNDKGIESLTPYSDAVDAARILLVKLTDNLVGNLQNFLNRLDSESLHNFRINIRKIRSLLDQLNDILPEPGLSYHRVAFKLVMDKTSLLRDIEVCNRMIIEHRKKTTSAFYRLKPVQAHMEMYEQRERKKLVEYLKSNDFNKMFKQWEDYLSIVNNMDHELERSRMPIRLVASEAIGLRYLKASKQVRKVLDNKNDIVKIHNLRKSGKKLRYLVDLFSDLYPPRAVNKVIKDLKKFQDCLGSMQDCEVQVRLIDELSGSIKENLSEENSRAVKHLIKKRNKQKKKCHKQAIKLIQNYSEGSNKAIKKLVRL